MIQDSDLDSFLRSDTGSDEPAAAPKTGSAPPSAGSFTFNLKSITPEISQAFKIAADAYGVDENVLIGIAARESGFNPQAIGPVTKKGKRAVGLMMFMPDTAKEYGIDPTDPIESVMAAAAYMRQSLDRFGGDYRKSIASYNWGRDRSEFDSPDWDKSLPKETSQYLAYVEQFIGADGEPAKGDSFGTARTEDRGFVPDVQDTSEMEAASKPYFGTSSPKSRRPQESLSPTVVGPSAPEDLPTTSKVPVDPKVRAEIYAAWDAADPGKRAMMEAAPGWAGMLARERAGVFKRFDAGKTGAVEQFDPRREARSNRLVGAGENATFADRAAKEAAASGIDPGNEVKFIQGQYGTIGTNRSPIGQMQDELAATRPGAKPEGVVEVASNAIMRGIHQNAGMGSALLAAGAKSIGADGLALDLLRSYFLRQIDAKKYPAQIEDFTKIDSLSDVPVYVLEGVLENAPQLVGTIGSSVIGATLAKKFGAKAVADMAVEQAGKELARRQAIGAAVGAGATSIGMETGSIYGDVAKDTGQERPGVAASFGVVAGALDAIPAFRAATKILGQDTSSFVAKEIFKRYGTEAVKQLRSEGGTEFLQTWIEEAAKTYVDGRPLLTAENLIQAIDAGLKGGLAGAVTGASSQGISDFRNRALIAVDDAAKKAKSDALNKWQSFADAGKRAPQERNAEAKIADISKAETIDEVAAKALEVVNTPVAPAASVTTAPDLAPTVDAITALENTNVSPSGDSGVVAAGAPASQADQSGPGVGAAGLAVPDSGGSGSVDTATADSSVPASGAVPQPGGESSPAVEPAKVWYGRRGDGYLTPEDAQRGLGERQRLQGQFDWRIEPTPDGKYRLAGYAPSTAGGTVQPAAPAPTTGVRSGQPAGPAAVAAVPQEREPARAPVAATQAPIPGSEAGNGFKHSGQKGERYRISVMSASNGAVALEKRLPGGTAATFYVGKDGNFVDGDEVNFIDNGQEKLWIPQNDQQREEAIAILDEMGSLALTDPARKAAKDRLRELVTGQASNASSAPTIRPDGTLKAEGDSKALKDRLTAAGIPARSVVSTAGGTVQASAPAYQSVNQSPITFSQGKGGSWFVGGDPATIRDLLRANGITNFLPTKDGAQLPANTDPEVIGAIRMMAEDFKNLSIQELKNEIRQRMGMTQPPKEPKQTRPFRDFLRSVGIRSDIAGDVVGESNRMRANQILPMTFRRNGLNLDALAERALEMGFLTQQDIDNPNDNGGVNRLVEMIKAESRGVRQAPIDEQTSVDAEQAQAEKELTASLDKLGVPASSYADLSVPQMNSMLNRIERRLRDARLRKQQLDVAEESRLEREAIQMADQITLADVSALERRSEMREASLEQFMRALLFTEQEIQDELAKQANQAQSDQAPAGDAATGPQGSAEADAGNTDRASQAGPAGEVDLFGAAPNASQQEANRIRKEREDRERAQQQSAPSPDEFALSGSDRAADVGAARGQGDLLAPSATKDAQQAAPVSSREGQMNLAARAGRIATLKQMNDRLRSIAPSEAWADTNIESASNAELDKLQDQISAALVAAQRGPSAVNPLRAELEAMSGAELRELMDRMGLAGKLMTASERVDALLAEDPADVRAAMQTPAPSEPMQEGKAEPSPKAKIDDFGEKLTGAREDDSGNVALYEPSPQPYTGSYETDLFGNPLPSQAPGRASGAKPRGAGLRGDVQPEPAVLGDAAQGIQGDYYVETIVSSPVSRELGASVIRTPADLAQATQYLYKSAVERFDAIVTDKDGKPLAVVGNFKGALSQTSVYPSTVVAEAFRVPGAAHIWFSHNHPSGLPTLSAADEQLGSTMARVFRGSSITPMGIMAVGKGRYSFQAELKPLGGDRSSGDIPKAQGRFNVPVYEREQQDERQAPIAINGPQAAQAIGKSFYDRSKGPGILLLDAQHGVNGWLPVNVLLSGPLRDTGGMDALYRAISRSNAGSAILVHGGELSVRVPNTSRPIDENIAGALLGIGVRVLDSIDVTTGGSVASSGLSVGREGVFFSRGSQPFYSSLRQSIEKINAKALPPGLWKDGIRGLLNKGAVKADEVEWSGLNEWLDLQSGKVTKDQVLAYLDANGVRVEEVTLGAKSNAEADKAMEKWGIVVARNPEDPGQVGFIDRDNPDDIMTAEELEEAAYPIGAVRAAMDIESGGVAIGAAGFPKYTQYTLPGGTNYREVLLTLPVEKQTAWRDKQGRIWTNDEMADEATRRLALRRGAEQIELPITDRKEPIYRSSHWDQPNVLAHIRMNDRVDAGGAKTLLIEEIQSDFAQDYRKSKDAINKAVDDDFEGIVKRMKYAGVLEVNCD